MSNSTYVAEVLETVDLEALMVAVNAIRAGARRRSVQSVAATLELDATQDVVLADATSGAYDVDLDAAPADEEQYTVVKVDASANAVTINGNGKNINGSPTLALASQWDRATVVYDAGTTAWYRVD